MCKRGGYCKRKPKKTRVEPAATIIENHVDHIELVPVDISDCDAD